MSLLSAASSHERSSISSCMHAGVLGEEAEISWRGLYASQNGWRGLHATCFEALELPKLRKGLVPPSCTLDPKALRWTAGDSGDWLVVLIRNRLEVSGMVPDSLLKSQSAASSPCRPAALWTRGLGAGR